MRKCAMAVAVTLGTLGTASNLPAQQILYTLESPNSEFGSYFGEAVSGAGDLNNDGRDDIIVGAPGEDAGASNVGRVYLFSGNQGTLIRELESPNPTAGGRFGCSVSGAGDVDGDGDDDVLAGAYFEDGGASNSGRAYVFSGATGALLRTLQSPNAETGGSFGSAVSGIGDVNNDAVGDLVIGAYGEGGPAPPFGNVYVFSGKDGALLHTLRSPDTLSYGQFGKSVSGAGDVNSDGSPDIIIGARWEEVGATEAGRSYVFSGLTGTVLQTLVSPNPVAGGEFGSAVSGAGDVDDDGYDDVIVGAVYEDAASQRVGRAYVFSGQGGSLVLSLQSPSTQTYPSPLFGCSVSGAGDVDGDGHGDVIVGAQGENDPSDGDGRAYVFSGRTGGLLYILRHPESWGGYFGASVAGCGDTNGNGSPEVIVGAPEAGSVRGRTHVFTFGASADVGSIVGNYSLAVRGPFPNPTYGDAELEIGFQARDPGLMTLNLYDSRGLLIATVFRQTVEAGGSRCVRWAPCRKLSQGVYWWRLTAGRHTRQRAMVVVR
jgi:hypothetical protein